MSIIVLYDCACPRCLKDRMFYESIAAAGQQVKWLDITGQDEHLQALGNDPLQALSELYIQAEDGRSLFELDA